MKAAIDLMETVGPNGFSLRKLASAISCDAAAILYHFKSKTGLERAMADALNDEIRQVDGRSPWRSRLEDLAEQYRALALRYPNTFPLLMRFWITGPADYKHAEMIYQAFHDAGLSDKEAVDLCFGWYASLLGMAAAEVCGMMQPASDDILEEIRALSPEDHPRMTSMVAVFENQKAGEAYTTAVSAWLDGIDTIARSRKPSSSR